MIAIEPDQRLFYEGSTNYGHAIWPSPVVSLATIIKSSEDWTRLPHSDGLGPTSLVFREDFFDPVTRIRRGRFYVGPGQQPQNWYVQQHPAFVDEVGSRDHQGYIRKSLFGFLPWSAFASLKETQNRGLVALGVADAFSLWRVIDVERVSTREDLVTLRARSPFGVLPTINESALPTVGREKILEAISKAIDTAYRAGPESVIDRCRDAAQASLGAWMSHELGEDKWRTIDLGKQIEALKGKDRVILEHSANVLARLHARVKPNEQVKREVRVPTEQDAECALSLLGMILRELGWTR